MNKPNHVVLDLFICPRYLLNNKHSLSCYVSSLIHKLNLTAIGAPIFTEFPLKEVDKKFDGENAYTITQVLGESLLSLHSYPEKSAIYIDLFACSSFDRDDFLNFSKCYFESKKFSFQVIKRLSISPKQFCTDASQN